MCYWTACDLASERLLQTLHSTDPILCMPASVAESTSQRYRASYPRLLLAVTAMELWRTPPPVIVISAVSISRLWCVARSGSRKRPSWQGLKRVTSPLIIEPTAVLSYVSSSPPSSEHQLLPLNLAIPFNNMSNYDDRETVRSVGSCYLFGLHISSFVPMHLYCPWHGCVRWRWLDTRAAAVMG